MDIFSRVFAFGLVLIQYWWLIVAGIIFALEPMLEPCMGEKWWKRLDKRWSKAKRHKAARVAATLAILVAAFLAFDDINGRLTSATAELKATQGQRDEARRQLQGLPPAGWSMKPEQIELVKEFQAKNPLKFPVLIMTVPGSPTGSLDLAYDLMNAIKNAQVNTRGDAEYSPRESGILVTFAAGTDPTKNEKAKALKEFLEKIGFSPRFAGHNNYPAGESHIVIGRYPSL